MRGWHFKYGIYFLEVSSYGLISNLTYYLVVFNVLILALNGDSVDSGLAGVYKKRGADSNNHEG